MKIEEIRGLTPEEMLARLEELRVELFNLRFQKSKNLLDRSDRLRIVRRDIARIITIMNQQSKGSEVNRGTSS